MYLSRRYLFSVTTILVMLVIHLAPVSAQGGDDFSSHGNRLFTEDFTTFVNRWDRLVSAKSSADYKNFVYQMDIRSPGIEIWSLPQTDFDLDRYYIEVNANIMLGSADDSFMGIIVNYQNENNFYVFGITPAGTFEMRWWVDGEWSEEILAEGTFEISDNTLLQIKDNEGVFDIGINGEQLATFESDNLGSGQFGLFAQAGHGILQVSFDDYTVYDIGSNS